MIDVMKKMETPEWIIDVVNTPSLFEDDIPLASLLKDSLYYPASGLNGTPVKFLSGNLHSFVYADYGITLGEYKQNLLGHSKDAGFKGYRCVLKREVSVSEVVPKNWRPSLVPTDPKAVSKLLAIEAKCSPFGHWSIWCKEDENADGADFFSFFYLGGEMSAVYQGLYSRLGIVPKVLAIIQPGAIGGEWEAVTNDQSFFKKVVASNNAGFPDYLLHGGFGHPSHYSEPCWSEYKGNRLIKLEERHAGLWKYAK